MAIGSKWTDAGQALTIDLLDLNTRAGVAATWFGAWGSSATTPAVGDTALVAENPEARTSIPAGSITQPAADTIKWSYAITSTAARTVQETAVLTLSAAGVCMLRIVHGSLSLDAAGDIVTYTPTLQLKDVSE